MPLGDDSRNGARAVLFLAYIQLYVPLGDDSRSGARAVLFLAIKLCLFHVGTTTHVRL